MKKRLIVNCNQRMMCEKETDVITIEQLSNLARSGKILKKVFSYYSVILYCDSLETLGQPFLVAAVCRILSKGKCIFKDDEGKKIQINISRLLYLFKNFIYESVTASYYIKKMNLKIDKLFEEEPGKKGKSGGVLFLRCDLPYFYMAGGSIGHIAGVLNNLQNCTGDTPFFLSSRDIPTVREDIVRYYINGKLRYNNAGDAMSLAYNENIERALDEIFSKEEISFIYQRSALNAFAGIEYAIKKKVPFVLEYNGSEIWIAKNWGNRNIKGKDISEKIERLTFEKANLITCVSRPLKQQLIDMGIDENKIIVTPNGVNTEVYRPDIRGDEIRKRCSIRLSDTVIGFIGTFGAWHGAELLVQAFSSITRSCGNVHLLMIGDGARMAEVRRLIDENGLWTKSTLTGMVPQEEGVNYLAACDILVSPTLRNPDGSPFFGSPTKLFEYMAMGKGIVASNLDQMAEVLKDNETALLVEPNDVNALTEGIMKLITDSDLRERLGKNAREEVCKNYTWRMHTEKIVDALEERCMGD